MTRTKPKAFLIFTLCAATLGAIWVAIDARPRLEPPVSTQNRPQTAGTPASWAHCDQETGVLTTYSDGMGTLTTDSGEALDLDFRYSISLDEHTALETHTDLETGMYIRVDIIPGGRRVEAWVLLQQQG